jgi:hypothetical protein
MIKFSKFKTVITPLMLFLFLVNAVKGQNNPSGVINQ